ncbi:hypothetical protein ACIGKQ_06965 [Gordonia sp. NPDC062954]|uniref:hypothetical protein n=1 Tax=Gordonia sp. NPDC062954 TaxID=3364003 RepID=UPI0037C5A094
MRLRLDATAGRSVDLSGVVRRILPLGAVGRVDAGVVGNSASVILTSPDANFAWRFVHDIAHVERGLSFSLPDEYELALWHLSELERDGFSTDSFEYAFLKADTLGQVIINAVVRRFPADQELFDLECQLYGFEQGILREIRRESS